MSRASVLLGALTSEGASTSEIYDRVGYGALARIGLIPYAAFRAELATLSAAGLAQCDTADDGSTLWKRGDLGRSDAASVGRPADRVMRS